MAEVLMDETLRFPDDISYGSTGGPGYSTDVVTVSSGHETRNINWVEARHSYDAAFGIRNQTYLSNLIEFFHACKGMAKGFRYKDWSDYTSSGTDTVANNDQTIGTGDGTTGSDGTASFQLVKNYTSGFVTTRTIEKPVGTGLGDSTVLIAVATVLKTEGTDYSINYATGVVTFIAPYIPLAGQSITAGFEFDVPCRFDTDSLRVNLEMYQHGTTSVPLVELRL